MYFGETCLLRDIIRSDLLTTKDQPHARICTCDVARERLYVVFDMTGAPEMSTFLAVEETLCNARAEQADKQMICR